MSIYSKKTRRSISLFVTFHDIYKYLFLFVFEQKVILYNKWLCTNKILEIYICLPTAGLAPVRLQHDRNAATARNAM